MASVLLASAPSECSIQQTDPMETGDTEVSDIQALTLKHPQSWLSGLGTVGLRQPAAC